MADGIDDLLETNCGKLYAGAAAAVGPISSAETWAVGHETDAGTDVVTSKTRFDVASLTKPVVTGTVALRLHERGVFDIDAPLGRYVPPLSGSERGAIPVRTLLTHTSGLPPYKSFPFGWDSADVLMESLYESHLAPLAEPGEWFIYSDLNFVHLADALRRVTDRSLSELAAEHVFDPAGMMDAAMGPLEAKTGVAGTRDWRWRDRHLRGEINDYIGAVMNGESGNAGLFASLDDLLNYAQALVNDDAILARSTLRLARHDAVPDLNQPHGLGWRLADGQTPAPAWTAHAFGHTGFTGTSIWFDPERDLVVVLLTNRLLSGENAADFARFRRQFHALAVSKHDSKTNP